MALPNNDPIYTRVADIQGGENLTTAANDYNGQNVNNAIVFVADATNGGFVQRLRFKALGTNVATVARIYINNGQGKFASNAATMAAVTPVGTQSTAGGNMNVGTGVTWFGKVWPVDALGVPGVSSAEATAAAVASSSTGSVAWSWSAVNGAASYILVTGLASGAETQIFKTSATTYTQTVNASTLRDSVASLGINNYLHGEISLPATTASASVATPDMDYPMNFALPPGYRVLVGLGTTVAAGWQVQAIGGAY